MDSSSISDQTMNGWASSLASGVPASQIEALRQISSHDSITGLANTVVALAGANDDEVSAWAAEAMESAIEPIPSELPTLIEQLRQADDGEVCYWAATMLGRLGAVAASAVHVLEDCLLHCDYLAARERSIWALSQIGPQANMALASLKLVANQNEHPRLTRLATEVVRRLTLQPEHAQHRKGA